MNRSLAYGLAGAVLAGVAVWVIQTRLGGESLAPSPLDEVDKMLAQTRKKVNEIQKNLGDFRQVLTQAAALESQAS
jgi:hypothetical protein